MDQVNMLVGGKFSPPLPADWQERYGKIIADLPDCPTKDYMQRLYACVKVWWDLDESTGERGITTHPGSTDAKLVRLDKHIADTIDEHIPWSDELQVMEANFELLEQSASIRYSVRSSAWAQSVRDHIAAKHFPEPSLYERLSEMARKAGEFLHLLPDTSRQQMEQQLAARAACEEEIRQALSSKTYAALPRPERGADTTPVRDAAKHLLAVVRELECCREPIFMGELR